MMSVPAFRSRNRRSLRVIGGIALLLLGQFAAVDLPRGRNLGQQERVAPERPRAGRARVPPEAVERRDHHDDGGDGDGDGQRAEAGPQRVAERGRQRPGLSPRRTDRMRVVFNTVGCSSTQCYWMDAGCDGPDPATGGPGVSHEARNFA